MQVSFRTDTARLRAQTRFSRRRKMDPILEKLRSRLATWVCPMSRPTESALTLVYAVSLRALCLRLIPAITAHTRCYTRIRVVHAAVAGRRTGSTFSSRESTTEKIAVRACQGVSVGDWENETPRADHKLIVATTNRSYDVLAHCGPFGCRERPVPLLCAPGSWILSVADELRAMRKVSKGEHWIASVVFGQRDVKLSRSPLRGHLPRTGEAQKDTEAAISSKRVAG